MRHARQVAHEMGWLMAAELRSVGVDFSFAPVLDLDHGVSEVIGDRAFGQSRDVSRLVVAMHGYEDQQTAINRTDAFAIYINAGRRNPLQ